MFFYASYNIAEVHLCVKIYITCKNTKSKCLELTKGPENEVYSTADTMWVNTHTPVHVHTHTLTFFFFSNIYSSEFVVCISSSNFFSQ